MAFQEDLDASISQNNSLLCVNLDPDLEKIHDALKSQPDPLFAFNKSVIDATSNYVCAYKPNSAFYEAHGAAGLEQLKKTVEYIKHTADAPVILDFKRGDIGNSNSAYLQFAFEYLDVDAVTIHPYLGFESWRPHIEMFADKGFFVLCRTSNLGAGEFQDLDVTGRPLYLHVAEQVSQTWNTKANCMVVVGATYPEELKKVREVIGDMTILAPGVGHQGGDLAETTKNGVTEEKEGLIVAVGRSVIYASNPGEEAKKLQEEINSYRS